MRDEQTNHEKLENKLVPEEEDEKPGISPTIAAQMGKDRARDLQGQQDGTISHLYDLSGGGK